MYKGVAMTIPYTVIVENNEELPNVLPVIDATFFTVDHIFNKFNPLSEISAFNASSGTFHCSKEFFTLLQHCDTFVRLSDGRFDPTIERLSSIWKKSLEKGLVPSARDLEMISPAIGWEQLEFEPPQTIHKKHPEVALDLGGIAKGHAVDLLFENIQKLGYTHLFVEWGGEVRVSGGHPEKRAWRVGIKNPQKPHLFQKIISLHEGSIATSGDYQQLYVADDHGAVKQFFHIYDRATLSPLIIYPTSLASASIQHESCMVADALASILLHLGNKQNAADFFQEIILEEYPTASCHLISHEELTRS